MAHTTHAPAPQTPTPAASPGHHPSRGTVVGWVLLAAGVAAAGLLILLTTTSGPPAPAPVPAPNGSLVDIPRNPDIAERWLAHHAGELTSEPGRYAGWPAGVPQSADAAERWFARQHDAGITVDGWPRGVARTPDALDRWFAQQR
jgi:hypothetical protein